MKPNTKIERASLIKMIQSERRAQYHKYLSEIESSLSQICDSGDALGPLVLSEKLGFTRWKLTGSVFFSRFRPGERVEIRVQKSGSDLSESLCDGWLVESVRYPFPGKIEVVIFGSKPLDEDRAIEVFLFKSSTEGFSNLLISQIRRMPTSFESLILGTDKFDLSVDEPEFKVHYDQLNDTQKSALHELVGNNLSGAIQGPPGTGKTHLLRAVVALALKSNMRVCVTSFTHAAVDNLLGKIVGEEFPYKWVRVGNSERVRTEFYRSDVEFGGFRAPTFGDVSEAKLIGATLHKLAFNGSSQMFDLLVVDEAGQVPVYFWPLIQRITKRLVLVGDQFQLPPVLVAEHTDLPFDNLFSLFVSKDTPMLETQYRMRREIQGWSSEKFYRGKLRPHVSVANRDYFSCSPTFITDSTVVSKQFEAESHGKVSLDEANFIADKVARMVKNKEDIRTVGVICPYRAQAGKVNAALQNKLGVGEAAKVLVDTVERFQGQEREAIFLSFGTSASSSGDLNFLADARRLNVSVTRAKSRFYCLFNKALYEKISSRKSADLNEFLNWVKNGRTPIKKAA
ncbi:DEAD/DEAH box helicase [Bdellovibrio bacteriovorus]|uniref:Putative DNA helicase n=1 Tax=Bdellovibrio bacteriovorus str. Tiberius TaxID=1069642 RepID=K7ZF15_BDEBC|nr:AAA domain-containing protein [Bdellovibrio bacteriovorus]AFY01042.1 putative DNA helicase [Bdellovibrio bacteriovorus str. Tiberius]